MALMFTVNIVHEEGKSCLEIPNTLQLRSFWPVMGEEMRTFSELRTLMILSRE